MRLPVISGGSFHSLIVRLESKEGDRVWRVHHLSSVILPDHCVPSSVACIGLFSENNTISTDTNVLHGPNTASSESALDARKGAQRPWMSTPRLHPSPRPS